MTSKNISEKTQNHSFIEKLNDKYLHRIRNHTISKANRESNPTPPDPVFPQRTQFESLSCRKSHACNVQAGRGGRSGAGGEVGGAKPGREGGGGAFGGGGGGVGSGQCFRRAPATRTPDCKLPLLRAPPLARPPSSPRAVMVADAYRHRRPLSPCSGRVTVLCVPFVDFPSAARRARAHSLSAAGRVQNGACKRARSMAAASPLIDRRPKSFGLDDPVDRRSSNVGESGARGGAATCMRPGTVDAATYV